LNEILPAGWRNGRNAPRDPLSSRAKGADIYRFVESALKTAQSPVKGAALSIQMLLQAD
jgi:hypothetical protein